MGKHMRILSYFLLGIGMAVIIIGRLYSWHKGFPYFTYYFLLPGYGTFLMGMMVLAKSFLDWPNAITVARMLLVPLILLFLMPGIFEPKTAFAAAAIFSVAAVSDILDGYLARRLGSVSVVGKFLDPLADKIIYITVLISLIPMNAIPTWIVLVVVTRELFITGLRSVAMSEGMVMDASRGGKMKTAFGLIGVIGMLIHYPYEIDFFLFKATFHFHSLGLALTYISLFFSIYSAFDYSAKFYRLLRHNLEQRKQEAEG